MSLVIACSDHADYKVQFKLRFSFSFQKLKHPLNTQQKNCIRLWQTSREEQNSPFDFSSKKVVVPMLQQGLHVL